MLFRELLPKCYHDVRKSIKDGVDNWNYIWMDYIIIMKDYTKESDILMVACIQETLYVIYHNLLESDP